MTNIIHIMKCAPKGFADWPNKLKSAEDIQLFKDVVASLALKDASRERRQQSILNKFTRLTLV